MEPTDADSQAYTGYYTSSRNSTHPYELGQYVLLNPPEGFDHKLLTPWRGPFLFERIDGTKVTLLNITNGRSRDVHVSLIKPFLFDPKDKAQDPLTIAAHDQQEFIIEKITNHTGSHQDPNTMMFRVR